MGNTDGGNAQIMGRYPNALLTPLLVKTLSLWSVGQDCHLMYVLERLLEEGIGLCQTDFGLPSFGLADDVQAPSQEFFDHDDGDGLFVGMEWSLRGPHMWGLPGEYLSIRRCQRPS
jgi:hypothetical protein